MIMRGLTNKPQAVPLQGRYQHSCQFAASSAPGAKTTAGPITRGAWEWSGELSWSLPSMVAPWCWKREVKPSCVCTKTPFCLSVLRAGSQNQIFLFPPTPPSFFFPECITGYCPYQTKPFHQRFFNTLYFSFILL